MSYEWPPPFYGYDNWLESQAGVNYAEDNLMDEIKEEINKILETTSTELAEKVIGVFEKAGIQPTDELLDEIAEEAAEEMFKEIDRHLEDPEYYEFERKRPNYHDN